MNPSSTTENILDQVEQKLASSTPFDKTQHDSESRLKITTLFLKWYFCLIAGSFVFCAAYNAGAAALNFNYSTVIPYLEVNSVVSLITASLGSGVGFVIGYYFKNKDER